MTKSTDFNAMNPEQKAADKQRRRQELFSRSSSPTAKLITTKTTNKTQTANLKSEINAYTKNKSLRSTTSTSRGQKLYNAEFQDSYGTSEADAMIANKQKEISKIQAYRPPKMGEDQDPKDYQISKLTYDAQYAQAAATEAANETKRVQEGVGARQEEQGRSLQNMFQDKQAKDVVTREKVNKEYTELSEEEKIMNWYDVVDGKLTKRDSPRIPEMESAWSGRAPIEENMSGTQKNVVAAAQRELLEAERSKLLGIDKPLSSEARLYQQQKDRNANIQADMDKYNEQKEGIQDDIQDLANTLGVTDDQNLRINTNGTISIVDKKTQEIFSPIEEAKRKHEEETAREVANASKAETIREDQIKSQHSDKNGNLTQQGKYEMSRQIEEYDENVAVYKESRGDALEKLIITEKKKKRYIAEAIEADRYATPGAESAEDVISKQEQQSILGMINDKIDASRDNMGNPTVSFATAKRMVDNQLDAIGGKDNVAEFDLFKAQFTTSGRSMNDALSMAYEQTGDMNLAKAFASQIGVPPAALKEQLRDWNESQGFDPDDMEAMGQEIDKQVNFYSGELTDDQTLAYLQDMIGDDEDAAKFAMQTAIDRGTYADRPDLEAAMEKQVSQINRSQAAAAAKKSGSGGEKSGADDAITRDVDSIMQGVLNLPDISVSGNYRAQVAGALGKKFFEAKQSGDIEGTMRASAAFDKEPSDSFMGSMEKTVAVLGQLGVLQENIEGVSTGPIVGAFKSKNPWDTEAQVIKAQLNAIVPNLARGVYGEVGVLTDNDIKTYSQTIPNMESPESVRDAVLYITVDMIKRNIETKIANQAAGQRDMSGYANIYSNVMELSDGILSDMRGDAPAPEVAQITQGDYDMYQDFSEEDMEYINLSDEELKRLFEYGEANPQD